MKAAVIMNKSAGSAKSDDIEKSITNAFKEVNIECQVYKIESSEIKNHVKEIVENGIDVVVAAGGDGTVSTIANLLAGNKTPLAVLAFGTLNHFAKDIGMPLDLEEAVKVIADGKVKMLDIAEVNERRFINNSSIGLYPHMVRKREWVEKQNKSNKWVAMFHAIINTFKRFPLYRVKVGIDGTSINCSTSAIFVGNNKYKMELFNPGTRSRLDEDTLTLYLTHCKTRFCMIKLAFLSLFNMLDPTKDFENYYIKEVTLETKKKTIAVSVDGEVIHLNSPLNYKILPKILPVIVP